MVVREISAESCAKIAQLKGSVKSTLGDFYEAFCLAATDVNEDWGTLKGRDLDRVWLVVYKTAKEILVDWNEGGGAEDGMDFDTFRGFTNKVKSMIVYSIGVDIASRATGVELKDARDYVRVHLKNDIRPMREKMVDGYNWVKERQSQQAEINKANAAEAAANAKAAASNVTGTAITPVASTPAIAPRATQVADAKTPSVLKSGLPTHPTTSGPLDQLRSFIQMTEKLIGIDGFSDHFVAGLVKVQKLARAELVDFESRQAKTDGEKNAV